MFHQVLISQSQSIFIIPDSLTGEFIDERTADISGYLDDWLIDTEF